VRDLRNYDILYQADKRSKWREVPHKLLVSKQLVFESTNRVKAIY
jgi:hypothetical protein